LQYYDVNSAFSGVELSTEVLVHTFADTDQKKLQVLLSGAVITKSLVFSLNTTYIESLS